ncbi:MAG TPA: glycosyltransferase family 87 protein [Candidatus Dormibacteraeota bacterium]|nr:glycosyltransferase family 87 protein [Candidatus Dormibacteraeota bacterium]
MSRRLTRALLALVLALAAAGLMVVLTQSPASRLSSDFTINYSAGMLVRQGHFAAPYQQAELGDMMRRVAPGGAIDARLPFSLPLGAAVPYVLLSLLPIELAFRLWQLITIALIVVAVLLLQRAAPALPSPGGGGKIALPALAIVGLLAAIPTWATLTEGQPTAWLFLGGAMVVSVLRWDSPALAAGAGLLLAVKPQYLPAYLVILFAARRWRSLAAAIGGAGLLLLSPLVGGGAGLIAMVHNALSANQVVAVRLNESWIGVIGPALPARFVTAVAIILYLGVLAALLVLAWRRPASVMGFALFGGALTVLASPHALPHDLLILAVPAWLAIVLYREGALPNPLPGLLAVDVALLVDLRGVDLPLGPLVMTAVVAWYGWQFRQRAAQRRRPPIGRAA